MKLALVGTGQMGQAVEEIAVARGDEIVARFNSTRPLASADGVSDMCGADVAIDFSLPPLVSDHLRWYCQWEQPAVIGTTGWYDALPQVETWVSQHEASVLYAPNFSLGIAVLVKALRAIGPLLDSLPEYDAALCETHHMRKVDHPSGTALLLARTLLDCLARKERIETIACPDVDALQVLSMRLGSVFGEHTVSLDSPFDRLTFTHQAKNRKGFARGALKAAEWLPGRKGLFTLDDLLRD